MGLKIILKGYVYRQHLYTVGQENNSATTLPLEVFTQRNFVTDFFEPPFGGVRVDVRTLSIAR